MGHSDIGVTLNTYTHLRLEDAVDELKQVEELENARKEMEKINGEGTVSQKMFRQYNMERVKALCYGRAFFRKQISPILFYRIMLK